MLKKSKKIPCIILARKNSKIELKIEILINHTINYLKKVKLIDDIIISTDDKESKFQRKN